MHNFYEDYVFADWVHSKKSVLTQDLAEVKLLWEMAVLTDIHHLEPLRLQGFAIMLALTAFSVLQQLFSVALKLRFVSSLSLKAEFSGRTAVEPPCVAIPCPLSGCFKTRIIFFTRVEYFQSHLFFTYLKHKIVEEKEGFLKWVFLAVRGTRTSPCGIGKCPDFLTGNPRY